METPLFASSGFHRCSPKVNREIFSLDIMDWYGTICYENIIDNKALQEIIS